jgi:inner membrane protein
MDNVTHSLAGLLLGEATVQLRRARRRGSASPRDDAPRDPTPGFRTTALVAAVVGANLPDVDVLYAAVALDKLGSLLHHRGHTHTFVAAVPAIALVWAGTFALWRRLGRRQTPGPNAKDGRWLLLAVAAAVLSHVTLDWTNNYGVHPFWPASNRWHYGDAVFIIEPWLWVAAVPPLQFTARRRAWRAAPGPNFFPDDAGLDGP